MEEYEKRSFKSIVFLIIATFLGSVFLTSEKFVDASNTPKFFFVVVFLLFIVLTIVLALKRLNLIYTLASNPMLWGINIICFFQACYGLFQFLGWLSSNHSKFAITGSFDNPAGFAAVLAIGFPLSLFLFLKAKKVLRFVLISILVVYIVAVLLSGSRSGILAILLSSFTFFYFQTSVIEKFRKLRFYKLFSVLTFLLFVGTIVTLFYQKKDSANGRFLIWKISSEIIKDKPAFGHGVNTFQAKYMDYQAKYFKNNPDSKYELLSDNVKHPFNEFLKVTIEFGLFGLIIIFSIILFIVWKLIKSKDEKRSVALSGIMSLLVFACFSYPLQYIATWLFLPVYLSVLIVTKEINLKNTAIAIILRSFIVIVCMFSFLNIYKQINAELKWKVIAINSLNGKTRDMLPEYRKLYNTSLKNNPFFLYNYGAELNIAGKYDESIDILMECKELFNDYDLQMILADNYQNKSDKIKAIEIYKHASHMIPARFLPLFRIFEIYKEIGHDNLAQEWAEKILNKKVKIPSVTVSYIQNEAETYLNSL